jgi:NAD(P)H-hydrate epimerase
MLDATAIRELGIPGIVLMKRAGQALLAALTARWPAIGRICVVCGSGNNAGDGYVVAGLALARGLAVQLLQTGDPARLHGDAARARDWAATQGVRIDRIEQATGPIEIVGDVIVDALLGTGITGTVRPAYAEAIAMIAEAGRPVVAVDVPSGLCSDTGRVLGRAVKADLTVTFIAVKRGLLTGAGPALTGTLVYDDLDLPAALRTGGAGIATLRWADVRAEFPRRTATAHKRDAGHVAILGGDHGMGGAVAMAGEAALRVGAGLVSVATRSSHLSAILGRRPELMVRAIDEAAGDAAQVAAIDLQALLERATVVAVGPGLGQGPWGQAVLAAAVASGRPLVLDADALNLCAASGARPKAAVVTPHPGEAARLLGTDTTGVQADRFAAVRSLAQQFGAAAVLKGAGSLVDDGTEVSICLHGNPGMASAGMGDVLTGVIAGLLAQGLLPAAAARLGVALHSRAGDQAAGARGQVGLLATDLIAAFAALLNAGD